LLTYRDKMSNHYKGPSMHALYKVSVHFAKLFQREIFKNIDQSETIMSCGGHVCSRIRTKCAICIEDIPYMLPTKFRLIWPNCFRGEYFFRNQPIRINNCLWWPCVITERDEMRKIIEGLPCMLLNKFGSFG